MQRHATQLRHYHDIGFLCQPAPPHEVVQHNAGYLQSHRARLPDREQTVIDRAQSQPRDNHHRQAKIAREIGDEITTLDRHKQPAGTFH
jgi:hypothetical protein